MVFEQLRDYGGLLIGAWLAVGLFSLLFACAFSPRRESALLAALSGSCILLLLIPLRPFYDPSFLALHQLSQDSESTAETLVVAITEYVKGAEVHPLSPPTSADVWYQIFQKSPVSPEDSDFGQFSCSVTLPVNDGISSVVAFAPPCDRAETISLVDGEISVVKLSFQTSTDNEIPLYFLHSQGGDSQELYYNNYLAIRRFTSVIRQLPKAVVVGQLSFTPWSKSYERFTGGGPLVDIRWGRGFGYSGPSIFLKGGIPVKSYAPSVASTNNAQRSSITELQIAISH